MFDINDVRKHTASHDLFNRIHSIAADEAFVQKIAAEVYKGRFDVVPNQRCGTWYCDPSTSSSAYAYFKSTDGHTSNWNFNLRRSNLPLAKHAEDKGGLIIVDSTRRGKRMPDALSKTVPIWCSVINTALKLRHALCADWDTDLYLPPAIVSPSERSQIVAKIPGWAVDLESSTLTLPHLGKPLRPFFVHPATGSFAVIPEQPDFIPVICVSASRWVGAGDRTPTSTRVGTRTVGFEYVPGAGDDDELWARGLKPSMYHAKRNALLSCDRDDLPALVDEIVGDVPIPLNGLSISEFHPIGVPDASSPLATDLGPPAIHCEAWTKEADVTIHIIEVDKARDPSIVPVQNGFIAFMVSPRSNGWAYAQCLSELITKYQIITGSGRTAVIMPARLADVKIDAQGTSIQTLPLSPTELISAKKMLIPILVALDCADSPDVDKSTIADSLHRLVTLWPDGNPPRVALKRVNEVLMSPFRWGEG